MTINVRDKIDSRIAALLDDDILDCPVDSVVGGGVVELCIRAAALIAPVTLRYGNETEECVLEDDVIDRIIRATVEQCNVWYFG